ncbi:hypothetical protein ABZ611_32775 [Streptomyces sp. NPDC007861]|uniref:hypothetical protein n=1 Tax=Streptomyces sp. NPDC007861 TaxID=3154893 RepID=UPI0033F3D345
MKEEAGKRSSARQVPWKMAITANAVSEAQRMAAVEEELGPGAAPTALLDRKELTSLLTGALAESDEEARAAALKDAFRRAGASRMPGKEMDAAIAKSLVPLAVQVAQSGTFSSRDERMKAVNAAKEAAKAVVGQARDAAEAAEGARLAEEHQKSASRGGVGLTRESTQTLHHIVPQKFIKSFADSLTPDQQQRVRHALKDAAPPGMFDVHLAKALVNLPVNYTLGPAPEKRVDDPGSTGPDINYTSTGEVTPRSQILASVDAFLRDRGEGSSAVTNEVLDERFIAPLLAASTLHGAEVGLLGRSAWVKTDEGTYFRLGAPPRRE